MPKKQVAVLDLPPAERNALADQLKVNRAWFYQVLTGRGEMKPIEATRVERESKGRVTRQMVCRTTYHLVWPELVEKEAAAARRRRRAKG